LSGSLQGAGGVGGLLTVVRDDGVYAPTYDANGNISEYIDAQGNIVAHREYDSFGNTIIATGDADAFLHWFSTKPWCAVTSLVEYEHRPYSPPLGRFLPRDPIEENGGLNLYGFIRNNPISKTEYLGMQANTVARVCCEGFPSPPAPTEPSVFNHLHPILGGASGTQNDNAWFEKNYSGWLEHAKQSYLIHFFLWIQNNCGKTAYNGQTPRWNVYAFNETNHGDKPQGWFTRWGRLGDFSIDLRTPISIEYDSTIGRAKYSWSGIMYVEDVLGRNPSEPGYFWLKMKYWTPERRIIRAEWVISDSGECCIKE